jgi:hypothetical protein
MRPVLIASQLVSVCMLSTCNEVLKGTTAGFPIAASIGMRTLMGDTSSSQMPHWVAWVPFLDHVHRRQICDHVHVGHVWITCRYLDQILTVDVELKLSGVNETALYLMTVSGGCYPETRTVLCW